MQTLKTLLCLLLCLTLTAAPALAEPTFTVEDDVIVIDMSEAGEAENADEGDYADEGGYADAATDLTPEELAMMDELAAALDEAPVEADVDVSNLEINPDLPDTVVNILLMGVDNRTIKLETGRADANIICSINKETGAITLTSIARDTAVEIPGYKNRNRVNTAFKFGSKNGDIAKGAELAMKTINRNFEMNISRYVVVNIHGLADIIEALGGVDLNLTRAEASAINYELFDKEPMDSNKGRQRLELKDGVQHLDGMQAVTYGRIRNLKGQNDINRNGRQRTLLETLLKQVMNGMDLVKLMNLIETALPYGATNLTLEEMVSLGMAVLGGDAMQNLTSGGEVLQQFGIPMEKQYGYRKFGDVSLVYISKKRMNTTLTALHELVYGESFVK